MLLFLLLWLRACNEKRQLDSRHEANLRARDKELRSYRLSNGRLLHEKELLEGNRKELERLVGSKNDSLKLLVKRVEEVVTTVLLETQYLHDTLFIPVEIPEAGDFQRSFSKMDEWISISGGVNSSGISIDQLSIKNTQRLVVGYRKGRPLVTVSNSNPYLITEAIAGQVIEVPQKRWVLGIGGSWNIYEPPAAGFFLGYKLLEF